MDELAVAVVIPCRNEQQTVADVVRDFSKALPEATVHVFDNASDDETADRARKAGAEVWRVDTPGKGNVVRRMFADVDADVYVLVDGDGTYDASAAPQMVDLVAQGGHDLVNAARVPEGSSAFRRGHAGGNRLFGALTRWMFGTGVSDVLSGYKACSRRLVKSFPVHSGGFEIETELAVHALGIHAGVAEIQVAYRDRPEGSESKLGTIPDGLRIARAIIGLVRHGRPLAFFGLLGFLLGAVGVALGIPVIITYSHTHLVPRFPTAILATGLVILASLSLTAGLVLDSVTRSRWEQRLLSYLSVPGPLARRARDRSAVHSAADDPAAEAGLG
ncbi:MAG: glycosyltransferase [Acidimicrobiales bacterium]